MKSIIILSLFILLINNIKSILDGYECIDNDTLKIDCKSGQVSEDECTSLGCCYKQLEENSPIPWCYNATQIIITTIPTTILTTVPITIINYSTDCEEKCLTCNEESKSLNLCISCNEEKNYKRVNYEPLIEKKYTECILNTSSILKKFYFNETKNEYRPCYETCGSCEQEGNAKYHNCLTCDINYMFRPDGSPEKNCVAYCKYYYISNYGQYKCLESLNCPEEAQLFIKEKNQCIDDCTKDDTYKLQYNGNCILNCPDGTINVNNICQENTDICTLSDINTEINNNKDLDIVETLSKTYAKEFSYTNNHISQFKNSEYNIIIYKNSICITELALTMPKVDFKNCYNKVQTYNNISDYLIIAIVDKLNNKNPMTLFSFSHPVSGEKLNATELCQNESITVEENILSFLNKNDSKYELMIYLTNQNINIFNTSDAFYTDLCYDFDNPLKKDIPLQDRIATFYPNITLCDDGCETKGVNVGTMTAVCNCKFVDIANNNLIKDNIFLNSLVGQIFDIIDNSNILVLKCYKYIFKYFKRSIGGFISLFLILTQIILTLIFLIDENTKIQKYVFDLTENYLKYLGGDINNMNKNSPPPKKLKEILIQKDSQNNKKAKNVSIIDKELIDNVYESNKNIRSIQKKPSEDINIKKKRIDTEIKVKNNKNKKIHKNLIASSKFKGGSKDHLITVFNSKIKKNKFNSILDNNKNYEITNNLISNRKTEKIDKSEKFFTEYLATPIDDMEYDDAIVKDNRKFCEFFIEVLKEKQIIANTFITSDPLKTRSMKIMLFVLNIMLYFVVNGLFFSESYISEVYNLEGEEGFFDFFPRSINRFFYTTIVSIIATFIADFFFVEEKKIRGIFKREKDDHIVLKEQIVSLINTLRISYLSFIIIVFFILLVSFYYLLCFNYVFRYTQIEWIKSSIVIMIIMQIISFLQCLLETILRFISFSCKSEKIYKISKLVD